MVLKGKKLPININEYNIKKAKYNCERCSINSKRKTIDDFKKEVIKLSNGEYEVLDNEIYKNNKEKVQIKHNNCGTIFYTKPNYFLSGNRCPACNSKNKHTITELKLKLPKDYEILSEEYINTDSKLKFLHKKCGNSFLMTNHDFFPGKHRCPYCVSSNGETVIREYLIKNKILFEEQKCFQNLKDKSYLKFDFFLTDFNTLIEFDGELHYTKRKTDKDGLKLKTTKYHDKLKNSYCYRYSINLLRIPFWQFRNINIILDKMLYCLNNKLNFNEFKKSLKLGRYSKNKRR